MLSKHNKHALVSYTDGIFTRNAASTPKRVDDNVQNDLIAFLSIVQKYKVDIVPIMWNPALGSLGEGGSGTISHSTISAEMCLAFKRFHGSGYSDGYFSPLISEVSILSQPHIRNHPNIINLEGVCWEITPRTEAVPVLIFEKAAWDLQQFMKVDKGMNMSINERLSMCADIGSAIMALHAYGVIHGDIKPQNVLVFEDGSGKITPKVIDFGYSTLSANAGDAGIFLPKSRPWNAPEHHFEVFKFSEAKNADIYSFGMLCLWVLFEDKLLTVTTDGETECVSFDEPLAHSGLTLLERLKNDDKMEDIANKLIETRLDREHESSLKRFFSSTVTRNSEKRESGIGILVDLFGQERIGPPDIDLLRSELETTAEPLAGENFRIAENLAEFVEADYRVRIRIREDLENSYSRNKSRPCASNIALQVAFCYKIGFGVKSDGVQCQTWLEKASRQTYDFEEEKGTVRFMKWKNDRMHSAATEGFLNSVSLIGKYKLGRAQKLEVLKNYEREAKDMAGEFGELHFIPLTLQKIIGELLDGLGRIEEAKVLRMRLRDQIMDTPDGIHHPYFIRSNLELVKSYLRLGEWKKAEALQIGLERALNRLFGAQNPIVLEITSQLATTYRMQGLWEEAMKLDVRVLEMAKTMFGEVHPITLRSVQNLAATYAEQGRWVEARELFEQAMEMSSKVHGQEHRSSLCIMDNLTLIFREQGQWKEAEKRGVRVVGTYTKIYGPEHPDTLISMENLASTYRYEGRWTEAEDLYMQVMETAKRMLGEAHPTTLKCINNLAVIYRDQGLWKEAEGLDAEALEMKKKIFGHDHPSTLISMGNLASSYRQQGRWEEAEELDVQVMDARMKLHGEDHPDTLTAMNNLATTYRKRGMLRKAEELDVRVLETRRRVLGLEHSDTMVSMGNLAATYRSQKRWKETEEMDMQVTEMRKRLLGREHPTTLISMNNLAVTYQQQGPGRWMEAEELFKHVMELYKRVIGQGHPYTLITMDSLASLFCSQRRWKEAEGLFQQVVETRKSVCGREEPATLSSMNDLALALWKLGRSKEAEELFTQVMGLRKRVIGQEHASTLTTMDYLAAMFCSQGRWKDAEELFLQVMETRKRVCGQEHPSTLTSMSNLASMRCKLGRSKEAEELFVQVIETRKRVFGEAHPDTLSAMSSLVCVSRSQYRDEASGTAEQATSRRPCSPDKDRQHSTSPAPNTKDERDEEVVKPT